MKSRIVIASLVLVFMLAVTLIGSVAEASPTIGAVRIAVLDVEGQSRAVDSLYNLLNRLNRNMGLVIGTNSSQFTITRIHPSSLRDNRERLDNYNLLIVSGAHDSDIAGQLGGTGLSAIGRFVRDGGGYIGIGAGAILALVPGHPLPDSSLSIVDGRLLEPQHIARGSGQVKVTVRDGAHPILQGYEGRLTVEYNHGPIILPAGNPNIEDFNAIVTFRSTVRANPYVARLGMDDQAAITASRYFRGRVVLFGFSPEVTPGLERLFAQAVLWSAGIDGYSLTPRPQSVNRLESKGIWLWAATVHALGEDGAEIVTRQLKEHGITDIYLLVKGRGGRVGFNSNVALARLFADNRDILQEVIDAAHPKGIRVHPWFCINSDATWAVAHPHDRSFHIGRREYDWDTVMTRISPMSPKYRQYTMNLLREVLANYPVDGIHIDYIRYPHILFGYNEGYEMAEARRRGIDMDRVIDYVNRTFVATPPDRDANAIFEAYDRGDPDVTAWVNMRTEIINSFAQEIVNTIRAAGRPVLISVALEPQGAYDSNWLVSQADSRTFNHVHYGQDFAAMARLFDYAIPMIYSREFRQSSQWVSVIYKETVDHFGAGRVSAGIQAYLTPETEITTNAEITAEVKYLKAHQRPRIALFKYGTTGLSRVTVSKDGKVMDIVLTNSLPANLTRVEITVTGEFRLQRILSTQNLANANVAVDGQTVVITGDPLMVRNAVASLSLEVDGSAYNPAIAPAHVRFFVGSPPSERPVYLYWRGFPVTALPTVTTISPVTGVNTAPVNVTIAGAYFAAGASPGSLLTSSSLYLKCSTI